MPLLDHLTDSIKTAMKAKDSLQLDALRAIKAAVLMEKTAAGGTDTLTEEQEIKLLQKLVKQRRDSAAIYNLQDRPDLATPEEAQAEVIAAFLPAQLSHEEIEAVVEAIIAQTGASGMQAMGQVIGMASKQLAGQADGKTISNIVRAKLS